MSNVPPPSTTPESAGDDADLLASLYLDGEATEEERARVDADPALLALVESFRTTARDVGRATPPPGLSADHINAALDLFDLQHRATTTGAAPAAAAAVRAVETSTPPTVSSLSEHRARRSRLPSWLGAAAVATLIVGGLGFAATLSRGDDEANEAATAETSASASSADRGADTAAMAEDTDSSGDAEMAAVEADESAQQEGTEVAEAEEAMEEVAEDAAMDSESGESAKAPGAQDPATFYAERGPINLADFEADTARDYLEQLRQTFPLQPIADSPCVGSPLVQELFGADSFYPVVFASRPAWLIFLDGDPSTALLVGPTCEIELF